jgi:hypothetical protein
VKEEKKNAKSSATFSTGKLPKKVGSIYQDKSYIP